MFEEWNMWNSQSPFLLKCSITKYMHIACLPPKKNPWPNSSSRKHFSEWVQPWGYIHSWLPTGWRQFQLGTCMHVGFMAANRLATISVGSLHACRFHGCQQAGNRLSSGWRQFQIGCLYIRGCQQAGDRLSSGWRQFQIGCLYIHGCQQAGIRMVTIWIGNLHAYRFHGCQQAVITLATLGLSFLFLIWWPIPAC